jgi:hypothetical protein
MIFALIKMENAQMEFNACWIWKFGTTTTMNE